TVKVKEDKGTRIKKAQERYIDELEIQAEGNQETAITLESHRPFLSSIMDIFKKVFDTKMEWDNFDTFWEQEKKRGNEYALAIESYNLENKTCLVRLNINDNSIDNDNTNDNSINNVNSIDNVNINDNNINNDNSSNDVIVELDLNLSLNKNIEKYYQKRKKALDKSIKTKVAIENIVDKLITKKEVVKIQKRTPFWFEKFHFFISSENEMVLGGKNAQLNEILVKRHLNSTDLYYHCDVTGASSVISKGRKENTINEAAYMALCNSKCWEEGVIRSVFYVEADQVSKTAPTGEFISRGSFMIKGKKNMISPYRLEYGVGLIFIYKSDNIKNACDQENANNGSNENKQDIVNNESNENDQENASDQDIINKELDGKVSNTEDIGNITGNINSNVISDYKVPSFYTNPDDSSTNIEYAMVMTAPWSLIKNYKYKVRICPGNEKKSKMCQDILKIFHEASKGCLEERAVKAVGVDEYMSVVLGKSKIAKIIK
ncbi:MAG: NFACT RNA binding domain-containing protein, partial [Paraclostridium sp.]